MKTASVISTGLHLAVLGWALVSFTGKTFEVTPAESLPVDIISETDLSQMMKGAKDAPKADIPKPMVEKKEAPKAPEDVKPKVTEKKEVKAQTEAAAPPEESKPDPIADKMKKIEHQETKNQPLPPKRPERPEKKQPKFEPDKIAALLDKRDPQRNAATGEQMNSVPTLGAASGNASKLSQSEIDALRARLMAFWNPPVGATDAQRYQVTIRIRFKRDGTLAMGPQVLTSGNGPVFAAVRDSAVRAVMVGQPYTMLKPEHYSTWSEMDFTFDTRDMFHDISRQ